MSLADQTTKEPQYQNIISHHQKKSQEQLGLMLSHSWHEDPKRLSFVLSRYKFVSKMLENENFKVLEVGCSSGFGSRIVRQSVGNLIATDFDPVFIEDAKKITNEKWPIDFVVH